MSFAGKAIEKARRDAEKIAESYNVAVSAVVWIGNNKYIVVKDGKQILI